MRTVNVLVAALAVLMVVSAPLSASPLRPPGALLPYVEAMQRGDCARIVAPLQTLAASTGVTGTRAAYLLAACLQRIGRPHDAQEAFIDAASRHPTLAPHARLAAAGLALRLGDAGAALQDAQRAAGHRPLAKQYRLIEAEALIRLGRLADADRILRELIPLLAERGDLAQAWWLRAETTERRIAASHYATVAWGFPELPLAVQAARRLREIGHPLRPSPAARWYRTWWLLRSGRTGDAERELALAVRGPLLPADAAEAWYRLGLLRLRSRSRQAARDFLAGARVPAQSDRASYWAGRALAAAGRRTEGDAIWQRLLRSHPASRWSARALLSLGLRAERRRAGAEADRIYRALAERFPHTPQGQEAAWRRGWRQYRRGAFPEAATIFLRIVRAHPESRRAPAALYWAAMARARRGADPVSLLNQLAASYPLTYHGQQARLRQRIAAPVAAATVPPEGGEQFAPAHEELGLLGFHREAVVELAQAEPALQSAHFMAHHLASAGEVSASVSAAEAALFAAYGREPVPPRALWMLAYPPAYRTIVLDAARATGVDPALIFAVIREESRFDPTAVSPAGAIGLMQLLPSTARFLIRGRMAAAADLVRPDVNIRYGAVYLKRMLLRFGGDVTLAVAAYNAGPVSAARFAATLPRDQAEFIELVPIEETRAYVQRVLESYGIYRWLYR